MLISNNTHDSPRFARGNTSRHAAVTRLERLNARKLLAGRLRGGGRSEGTDLIKLNKSSSSPLPVTRNAR